MAMAIRFLMTMALMARAISILMARVLMAMAIRGPYGQQAPGQSDQEPYCK